MSTSTFSTRHREDQIHFESWETAAVDFERPPGDSVDEQGIDPRARQHSRELRRRTATDRTLLGGPRQGAEKPTERRGSGEIDEQGERCEPEKRARRVRRIGATCWDSAT